MTHTYTVLGSDARQTWLSNLLRSRGVSVLHTALREDFPVSGCVVFPLPTLTQDGLIRGLSLSFSSLLQRLPSGVVLWGSGFSEWQAEAAAHEVVLRDFSLFPQFAQKNAVPTAEGAIRIAMEELPVTIDGGRFLVIGCGRIGSALASRLLSLGGQVTVASRTPEKVPFGCRSDLTGCYREPLNEYDAVFNTVPLPVFLPEHCAATRDDCVLIDLASTPGGIASSTSRRKIHALGLPARTAPKTAAGIMLDIMTETEEQP